MKQGLDHWADITIIIVYFVFVLCVGLWVSIKTCLLELSDYFACILQVDQIEW